MTAVDSPVLEPFAGRPVVTVLTDRCAGCQECIIRCPTGALTMDAARWVAAADSSMCVGCRQCVRTCPFSAITVDGPLQVAERVELEPRHPHVLRGDLSEIRPGFTTWREVLAEAERCLQCPDPTCAKGCPAHNDIPGFIGALRDGDAAGAQRILRRTTVLPDICSRVCDQSSQCEGACSWSLAGGVPVSIGRLERFVAETAPVAPPARHDGRRAAAAGMSIAIVGSGPAGIGAAWSLVEAGAEVTVFEKDATPGGLLGWGIPDFTLPAAVADRPWRQLQEAGVDLRCGVDVRPEDVEILLADHDAVILAHGATQPLRLPVPGNDLEGVTDATTFLHGARAALEQGGDPAAFLSRLGLADPAANAGRPVPRVLVLGAGNTAMDVARTARRLGLDALCVDWLDERFALVRPDELAESRHEGVEVRFSRTVTRLAGDGRVVRAELARTAQPRRDRLPKVLGGDPEVVDIDLVVMAMGYRGDPAFAPTLPGTPVRRTAAGLPDRRWTASGIMANAASAYAHHNPVGTLALGRETGLDAATLPVLDRVWVAGDALVGPSTVVEAMTQGRRAAESVIAGRPSRPGRPRQRVPRRVLVCYESQGGTTARAAEAIAASASAAGHRVRVLPIGRVGLAELAAADLIVVGTWVEGLVVAGVRPAKAMRAWLDGLPRLGGKAVAVFCTFAVAPKGALPAMRRTFEARGAVVVAQAAFGPRERRASGTFGPTAFGSELLQRAWPGERVAALVE